MKRVLPYLVGLRYLLWLKHRSLYVRKDNPRAKSSLMGALKFVVTQARLAWPYHVGLAQSVHLHGQKITLASRVTLPSNFLESRRKTTRRTSPRSCNSARKHLLFSPTLAHSNRREVQICALFCPHGSLRVARILYLC